MRPQNIHISIPQPCHESWDRMDATASGAFCHSCQKEVVDFSSMTDREVVEYLEKHKTGCGRFRRDQLDTKLIASQTDNGIFNWRILLLGLLPFATLKQAAAMPGYKIINDQSNIPTVERKDTALVHSQVIDSVTSLCGTIVDEKGEGMFSAAIVLLNDSGRSIRIGTTTDFVGDFSFVLPYTVSAEQSFKVSYIGYESQTMTIRQFMNQSDTIRLEPRLYDSSSAMMTGALVSYKQTPARKMRNWFNRIFGIKHKYR